MSDSLYSRELLRLAADAAHAGRLPHPDCTGTSYNPVCGDRVTTDIRIDNGRIAEMAIETRACVFTQAAASIVGGGAVGRTQAEIVALHKRVAEMLAMEREAPEPPFGGFVVFGKASDYRNRRRCILLPIEALLDAFRGLADPRSEGIERQIPTDD